MHTDRQARRTIAFVNIAHAFDHFILLIYPTAVIAIAAERGLDYATLISLATGAFVAFGLFSLPMGWIAERVGRRNMLAVFFIGYGASCLGMATATSQIEIALWLLCLGVFAAIYHPIGTTMLVASSTQVGRDLGLNGVCGNLGAASASAVTAAIASTFGWPWAFVVPGFVCMAIGIAFCMQVPPGDAKPAGRDIPARPVSAHRAGLFLVIFAIAIVAAGMTFNMTTIALPKVVDERMGMTLPLVLIGTIATVVFLIGALTQVIVGRLIDGHSLLSIFLGLSTLQPAGLLLAATTTGAPMLAGLAIAIAAICGQVIVNDAMIARYIPTHMHAKAYSVRYFLGFTASGFAAPLIAVLHAYGGFPLVLLFTAAFGAIILACALAFWLLGANRAVPVT